MFSAAMAATALLAGSVGIPVVDHTLGHGGKSFTVVLDEFRRPKSWQISSRLGVSRSAYSAERSAQSGGPEMQQMAAYL